MEINPISIVMLGATGAVGNECLKALLEQKNIKRITLLGRRENPDINSNHIIIKQHQIDISDHNSYAPYLSNHSVAICTLGVGEPSKMSKEEFVKIDKTAVLDFAKACKEGGIQHFELLSSVGVSSSASSFYLRTKGELTDALEALNFNKLSIFQPSMILTINNRYGFSQAVVLKVWPLLKPLLFGNIRKYRGVKVKDLGQSMALNIFNNNTGNEVLQWDDFQAIIKRNE